VVYISIIQQKFRYGKTYSKKLKIICRRFAGNLNTQKGKIVMKIQKAACAGTLESSDTYVELEPGEALEITVESVGEKQFGQRIEQAVKEVLEEYGVECAKIRIIDRGALDCTIRARVATAVLRAGGED
jgi:citrate lyase subunit gamma (acyl carrier protein)